MALFGVRMVDNQTSCAIEMFDFCVSKIEGTEFTFIKKKDVDFRRVEDSFLAKRLDPTNLYYFLGTESFHHFTTLSKLDIGVKRVSTDLQFKFVFNLKPDEYRDERDNEAANKVSHSNIRVNGGEHVASLYHG